MKKRHILFYYPSIGLGGQQTQILQVAEQLKLKGHRVSWLYQYGTELKDLATQFCQLKRVFAPKFNQSRLGLFRIINRWLYYNLVELQLRFYTRKWDVDVILMSNTIDSRVGNRVVQRSGLKHFRLLGGSMAQVEPHLLKSYYKLNTDKYVHAYFGWPAVFEELKTQKVPAYKFINMPFAVNTNKFFPLAKEDVQSFRNNLGISNEITVIGWVGRTAMNMQLWDTLRLGRMLKERGVCGFKLLFIGAGSAFEHLQEEVKKNNLSDETILTGWIPYDEVNKYINAMDIVPLLESDPQGGSIVREAMACGRVALSVDGPSGTQALFMRPGTSILVNSDNYLVEAANCVEQLIGKADEIDGIGKAGRDYVMKNLRFANQAEIIVKAIETH